MENKNFTYDQWLKFDKGKFNQQKFPTICKCIMKKDGESN